MPVGAVARKQTKSKTRAAAKKTPARVRVRRNPERPHGGWHRPPQTAPTHPPRRAIFIDVENTSSEDDLLRGARGVEASTAARNPPSSPRSATGAPSASAWPPPRSASARSSCTARPATGVRDWSDLWIAVAAGCWLGEAQPGDVLEIVSNDRAFDAVGDAAAARGVVYRRLLHKRGSQAAAAAADEDEEPKRRRRSRGVAPAPRTRHRRPRRPSQSPAPRRAARRVTRHCAPLRRSQPQAGTSRAVASAAARSKAHGATRDQIGLGDRPAQRQRSVGAGSTSTCWRRRSKRRGSRDRRARRAW